MLRIRGIRRTVITGSFMSSGLNLFSAYMPVYAHSLGLSASVIGIIVALNSSASFVIRVVLPLAIARFKEERVLAVGFCCGAVALTLIPLFQSPVLLGMLAFFFGIGMGAGQPIITMLIFRYAPEGRSGEAIGLKVTTNHLTNMVSPILFGSIASALGLPPMFWLNAAMMASGARMMWNRK
jgi:MFS family permease